MTEMSDEGIKNLCAAIIKQATEDYTNAIVNNDTFTIKQCERFFDSKWFAAISMLEVDGEEVKNRLYMGATQFADMASETIDRGFVSKKSEPQYRAFVCPLCGGDVYSTIRRRKIRGNTKYTESVSCKKCCLKLDRPVDVFDETAEK